ncbi:glycoside hydrolase family 28 protein [Lacrimispora sp.]|uniref:glycoside hydrolase family 28 protein n=1 Tax=Lacrimispora sp. TaxID=2719234 RepID=UPI003994DA7B
MESKVLQQNARSVVLELLLEDRYETRPYELWVNGKFLRNDRKMVVIIDHLEPDTQYRILFQWDDKETVEAEVSTSREYVTLNVRKFGARGDGICDDTGAIQAAVMCCPPNGRVFVPAGTYRIRNLFLKNGLTLELGKGALLQAFQERNEYPVLPGIIQSNENCEDYNLGTWEGNPLDAMASVITGIAVENVTICGEGTIDGGGDFEKWWISMVNRIPPYRPRVIFLNRCRNILIQGITIRNSPAWNIHPYFSENIRIYGITLESPDKSHNTDGIDPESCSDVEIAGVHFSVGDDCIAIKSGKIYMGKKYRQPSQRISIRHCLMERGHGAVTIGSEIAGGVREVRVSQCVFKDTDRGLRIKTRRGRGKDSIVDEIDFSSITMDGVKSPFVVNCFYYCDPDGKSDYVACQEALPADERTPEIRSLSFSEITCKNAHHTGICIYGLPEKKIQSVVMKDIAITYHPQAEEGIAAMMRECAPTRKQGIFIRNVKRLVMQNVHATGAEKEFECESVLEINRA